jgi:hypothetical protein
MNYLGRWFSTSTLIGVLCLSGLLIFSNPVQAQRKSQSGKLRRASVAPRTAYEHGYVAGYNDGYTSGKSDYNARLDRDYQRGEMYRQANRGYEQGFGDLTEYQDGYRLGYEIAYTDGYYGRPMDSTMPPHVAAMRSGRSATPATTSSASTQPATRTSRTTSGPLIPDKTEVRLRLTEPVSTRINRQGDRFKARVIEPRAYEGAIVEGHIAKLNRSGKLTGKTEMALEFDTVTMPDGRRGVFRAQIEKIYASESVKSVDEEGNVETSSKTRDTEIRSAGGAVLGAIIGGIAGGGKGAAIGAILGAGAGAGSVSVPGNKEVILDVGTEMSVRTAGAQREKIRR